MAALSDALAGSVLTEKEFRKRLARTGLKQPALASAVDFMPPTKVAVGLNRVRLRPVMNDTFSIGEAADLLFVSIAHIRKLVDSGELKALTAVDGIVRIDRAVAVAYKEMLEQRQREYLRRQSEDTGDLE
jgi:excisionase family DNA binding protein